MKKIGVEVVVDTDSLKSVVDAVNTFLETEQELDRSGEYQEGFRDALKIVTDLLIVKRKE